MNRRFAIVILIGSLAVAGAASWLRFGEGPRSGRPYAGSDDLRERFFSDFESYPRRSIERSFIFADRKAGVIQKLTIKFQSICDGETDCFSAAIYVPKTTNARAFLEAVSEFVPQTAFAAFQDTQFADMSFCGWVVVYHEDRLSSSDQNAVRQAWARHSLSPTFRESDSVMRMPLRMELN